MMENPVGEGPFQRVERYLIETDEPFDVEAGVRRLRSWMEETLDEQPQAAPMGRLDLEGSAEVRAHRAQRGGTARLPSAPADRSGTPVRRDRPAAKAGP